MIARAWFTCTRNRLDTSELDTSGIAGASEIL